MATKLYFHRGTHPQVNLPDGNLNETVSATTPTTTADVVNHTMNRIISGVAQTNIGAATLANTNPQPQMIARFVSDELAAQTFALTTIGDIALSIGGSESNAQSNFQIRISLATWRPSTNSLVTRIHDLATNATAEPGTAQTSLTSTNAAGGTSATIVDGDVLICEIWRDSTAQGNATARTNTIFYDGTTEASTTNNAAFINFPNDTLKFLYRGHGQAQAKIKGIGRGYSQAQAFIAYSTIRDTFTRSVTDGLGTADLGGPWESEGAVDWDVDGNQLLIPTTGVAYAILRQSVVKSNIAATFKVDFSFNSNTTGSFTIGANVAGIIGTGWSIRVAPTPSNEILATPLTDGSGSGQVYAGYIANDVWRVEGQFAKSSGATASRARIRAYKIGTTPPQWFTTNDASLIAQGSPVKIFTQQTASITLDNLEVTDNAWSESGQAQAFISKSKGLGQAQAHIKVRYPHPSNNSPTTTNIVGGATVGAEPDDTSIENIIDSETGTSWVSTVEPTSSFIWIQLNQYSDVRGFSMLQGDDSGLNHGFAVGMEVWGYYGNYASAPFTGAAPWILIDNTIEFLSGGDSGTWILPPRGVKSLVFKPLINGTPGNKWELLELYIYGSYTIGPTFAQAQAEIAEPSHRSYAQAQADIKQTYRGYAQAQANIKQSYRAYAQSQAQIKRVYLGYGQAQACIKGNAFAQAQADIKQTYQGYGQSNAFIMRLIGHDDFNRVVGSGGGSGNGGTWGPSSDGLWNWGADFRSTSDPAGLYVDGAAGQYDVDWGDSAYPSRYPVIKKGIVQFDIWIPADTTKLWQYWFDTWIDTIKINRNFDGTTFALSSGHGTTFNVPVDASSWYTVKALMSDVVGATIRFKVWKQGTQEPDWQYSSLAADVSAGFGKSPDLLIVRSGGPVENAQFDNLYLWSTETPFLWIQPAQAKASIKSVSNKFAQAQAYIKGNAFAQAQARIMRLVAYDDFQRTVSNGWGNSSDGSINWGPRENDETEVSVDGSVGLINPGVQVYMYGYPLLSEGMVQFDIWVSTNTLSLYAIDSRTERIEANILDIDDVEISNFYGDAYIVPPIPDGTWLTVKATFNHIEGQPTFLKAWITGTPEPNWQVESISEDATPVFGSAGANMLIETTDSIDPAQFDNFYLWTFGDMVFPKFAQAQAKIVIAAAVEYQSYGQAQACIKGNAFGQSQADIKQIYRGYAQAQADIKATSNAYAQAQGTIKTTYNAFAQANADIKATSRGYAQAQADIKQVYQGYAQAQVWIEATVNRFAQAQADIKAKSNSFAQAQAKINAFGVKAYAQALSNIKGIDIEGVGQAQAKINAFGVKSYAQAQAEIKQTYRGHGQAQGSIINTYNGFAQALADVKATDNAFAQSEAHIKAVVQGYATANARIGNDQLIWVKDTFTRVDTVLGTPDIGPPYDNIGSSSDYFINGTQLIIPSNGTNGTIEATSDINAYNVVSSIEFTIPTAIDDSVYFLVELSLRERDFIPRDITVQVYNNLENLEDSSIYIESWNDAQEVSLGTLEFDTTYILKLFTKNDSAFTKVWRKIDPEPDWLVEIDASENPYGARAHFYVELSSNNEADRIVIDNYNVSEYLTHQIGQAQADIKAKYNAFAQAQSSIKQTYQGYAQAHAQIKQTYNGYGQAQACVKGNAFGQAQADIKQVYFGFAQAQAAISQTYFGFAQAQGWIKATVNSCGQAQGQIKQTYQAYGQAQADIKSTYQSYGQAQADVKAISNAYSQAQANITQVYQGYAQANADIKAVSNGYGQSQGDIKQTYQAYGQSQADILATYQGYAQAQACIKGNGFGQAQADIKATSNAFAQAQAKINAFGVQSYGQAQATVLGAKQGYGQAQAKIKTTRVHGQAQAFINKSKGLGQAQARIKQTYQSYAQAQAYIKGIVRGYGQACADILKTTNAFAQANADIEQTYNSFAQAKADIKATSQGYGQAQSDIKATGRGYGQACADIEQTYNAYGQAQATILVLSLRYAQAQATIKVTTNACGQAQANIKQISRGYGQGQAWIEQTYNSYGQAQGTILLLGQGYGQANAYIKLINSSYANSQAQIKQTFAQCANAQAVITTGNVVYAQAQAQIRAANNGFGQAQAYLISKTTETGQAQAHIVRTEIGCGQAQAVIVKSAGYAQAQAYIFQPHTLKKLVIRDRASLILVIDDRINEETGMETSSIELDISDRLGLQLTISDRDSQEVTINDIQY